MDANLNNLGIFLLSRVLCSTLSKTCCYVCLNCSYTQFCYDPIMTLTLPSWVTRMSPATANRVVDAARSILNTCLPDIYIYTDHMKGPQSGK